MIIGELIAAFAELVVLLAIAGMMVLELALSVAAGLLEAVFGIVVAARRRPAQFAPTAPPVPAPRFRKWVRRIGIASLICLVLTGGLVLLLNTVLFDWCVRQLVRRVATRSGAVIDYDTADGNLLTGEIVLRGVTLDRWHHPTTAFKLRAKSIDVDLDVWSLLGDDRRIEHAHARGIRGTIERVAKEEPKPWYTRRLVHVDDLQIYDAEVDWIDRTRQREDRPVKATLTVENLTGRDLRTRWIAFDLLFRVNAAGRIGDAPFVVSNERADEGGTTVWRFDRAPAPLIGDYVGGPVGWLTKGLANVNATTTWTSPTGELAMDWSFDFSNVRAERPVNLTGWRARLADPVIQYVNDHAPRLPLNFKLKLDASGFEGSASGEAAGLWDAVADAATEEFARILGINLDKLQDFRQRAADPIRSFRRPSTAATGKRSADAGVTIDQDELEIQ